MQIFATARNACISGDLSTAEELLTQAINADLNIDSFCVNRSVVMARKQDWDHALHDALKVIHTDPPFNT